MNVIRRCISKVSRLVFGQGPKGRANEASPHKAYLEGGQVPWSDGYSRYRNAVIENALVKPSVLQSFAAGTALPKGYGFKLDERCVEIPWIFSRYPQAKGMVLDAGCAYLKFGSIRRRLDPEASVTLLTLDKRDMAFPVSAKEVCRLEADMRNVPLERQSFDAITCVSTLEHVGMDNTQLYTADESFREQSEEDYIKAFRELGSLLKTGGSLFVTVPFGLRKNHGWLQVFDAPMLNSLIGSPDLELVEETIFQHQATGWVAVSRELAEGAIYFDVHASGADKANSRLAAAEAVACLWFKRK